MKKIIIIIIAVVALILLAFQAGLFSFTNQTDQAEEVQNDTNNTPSETASISESFQNENTETYQIVDQSTVSYTAQKEFFSKPTEAVVGTTNDVDGQIYINEINTLPGFTKISMFPQMMQALGFSYQDLITEIIQLALKK